MYSALSENAQLSHEHVNCEVIPFSDLHVSESECYRLGGGSFGSVFKAQWKDTVVAAKRLNDGVSARTKMELEHEANIHGKIQHANIVRLFGIVLDNQPQYIILELMKMSLFDLLKQSTQENFLWTRRLQIALDIMRGLKCLHDLPDKVLHRDIKSANVLLDDNGTAKLADFGLARFTSKLVADVKDVGGTVGWMAPELFDSGNSERYSIASDMFAFGTTLWEISSLKKPFSKLCPGVGNEENLINYIRKGNREKIPATTPGGVQEIIGDAKSGCWAQHSRHRPTVDDVILKLERLLTEIQSRVPSGGDENLSYSSSRDLLREDIKADNSPAVLNLIVDKTRIRLFYSYCLANKPFVQNINKLLRSRGFTKDWIDSDEMSPGDKVWDKMSQGINDCHVFLACLSDRYCVSDNCLKEIREANTRKKLIIPLIVGDISTNPYPVGTVSNICSGLLYSDFRPHVSQTLEDLENNVEFQAVLDTLGTALLREAHRIIHSDTEA